MEANVVAPALDAAQSIDAGNSLEKMLAHQMALCHAAAFRTISKANNRMDTVESAWHFKCWHTVDEDLPVGTADPSQDP